MTTGFIALACPFSASRCIFVFGTCIGPVKDVFAWDILFGIISFLYCCLIFVSELFVDFVSV
jgi:hypothetical protein